MKCFLLTVLLLEDIIRPLQFINMKRLFRNLRAKFSKKVLIGLVVFVVLGVIVFAGVKSRNQVKASTSTSSSLIAQTEVGQSFKFDALLPSKKLDDVELRVTNAEKRTEILVQGKPAQTKGDNLFLVLNLEIDNAESLPKYMSPVDVFRLINADGRQFAADVHSGMLEIQPLSTKLNKIAFVVNKDQKEFNLKAGDLDGDKQDIKIVFN